MLYRHDELRLHAFFRRTVCVLSDALSLYPVTASAERGEYPNADGDSETVV